jgi:sugar O-acyltransferase (sialic acid O-acetyltransferase NeuD family)
MKQIAIYGAGGYGREVACYLKNINKENAEWNLIGFFDDGIEKGTVLQYGIVLGDLAALNKWESELAIVFAIGSPNIIKSIVGKITNKKISFPNIIDPSAVFLDRNSVRMGKGNIIGPNSIISCNVILGDFNMINLLCHLGHEAALGNYNVLMPSVNICGGVTIGNYNFLAIKSTVLQYLSIPNNVLLGAGSTLMVDAKADCKYFGNPARTVMKNGSV